MPACECGACGQRFSGVSAFDAHQSVRYDRKPAVVCRDPLSLIFQVAPGPPAKYHYGMVRDQHGRWAVPGSDADKVRLAAMKARAG